VEIKRVVSWFSCGATSAIATKLTIEKYKDIYPIVIAYCDTGSEHPDNKRFLKDCEKWYGQEITILKNPKFNDIYDVFADAKFIANKQGARCSLELKKTVRQNFEDVEFDLQIFGFDLNEKRRAKNFKKNNPLVMTEFPLIDNNISKSDCILQLINADIEIPIMYKMVYKNNNCIGCVKGAAGYWNKIKKDFPEIFEKTAQIEEEYGAKLLVQWNGEKLVHITMRELKETTGNYKSELPIECGFVCGTGDND
jgi:3'-phosphoadenosine 5'-phosphosulfate sulfotransferase (PAPS reductase)/FAD synthetase